MIEIKLPCSRKWLNLGFTIRFLNIVIFWMYFPLKWLPYFLLIQNRNKLIFPQWKINNAKGSWYTVRTWDNSHLLNDSDGQRNSWLDNQINDPYVWLYYTLTSTDHHPSFLWRGWASHSLNSNRYNVLNCLIIVKIYFRFQKIHLQYISPAFFIIEFNTCI